MIVHYKTAHGERLAVMHHPEKARRWIRIAMFETTPEGRVVRMHHVRKDEERWMIPYKDQEDMASKIRKHWKRNLCTKGAMEVLKAGGIYK